MGKKHRDMSMVVGVGEVQGHTVEIMKTPFSTPERFEWRAVKDDEIVHISMGYVSSIEEAIAASIEHFFPGAEAIETEEPTENEYVLINALLHMGGLNEPIETLEEAGEMYDMLEVALHAMKLAKDRAASDVADIEDILCTSNHGSTQAIENLNQLLTLFLTQTDVLIAITERSCEALASFIDPYKHL